MESISVMNLYALQFDIAWEDKTANFTTVRRLLDQTRPTPGSLLVLPEMFATGFSMNALTIAEDKDGPTFAFLAEIARQWKCLVLGGVPTNDAAGVFRNEAILMDAEGALIARYAKMYPFTPGGESERYAAGESPILVDIAANSGGFRLAPFICYDLRFPEAFRAAAAQGASLYTVIASWPEARVQHWVTLLQARAIENQSYVIGVNRCGSDPSFRYPGRSLIMGPDGTILADAGESEGVIQASLDAEVVATYGRQLPFLQDMRRARFRETKGIESTTEA